MRSLEERHTRRTSCIVQVSANHHLRGCYCPTTYAHDFLFSAGICGCQRLYGRVLESHCRQAWLALERVVKGLLGSATQTHVGLLVLGMRGISSRQRTALPATSKILEPAESQRLGRPTLIFKSLFKDFRKAGHSCGWMERMEPGGLRRSAYSGAIQDRKRRAMLVAPAFCEGPFFCPGGPR